MMTSEKYNAGVTPTDCERHSRWASYHRWVRGEVLCASCRAARRPLRPIPITGSLFGIAPRPRRVYVGYRCPDCGNRRLKHNQERTRVRCTTYGCYYTRRLEDAA